MATSDSSVDATAVTETQPSGPVGKVRAYLEEHGLDAAVVMSPENVAYVGGVAPPSQRIVRSRHAACIVPRSGSSTFVVVQLEEPLVRERSHLDETFAYQEFVEHPVDVVADTLSSNGLSSSRIGIEESFLPVGDYRRLAAALPGVELTPIDDALSRLRAVKTPAEIEAIRTIGRVAAAIHEEVAELFTECASEQAIGNFIAERYGEEGGDALTMLVVASGERSAFLNAPPTKRTLRRGDLVRLDIIGTSRSYYSDVARTGVVGEPDDEQRRIYNLLYDVHRRLVDAIRPGTMNSELYRIYVDRMTEAGLPPYHFVGHGLGVSLHEEPFIDALHSVPLEAGMVLCIEPLTAIDGRFGVQIEDEILVTPDGCELLTEAPPDFLRMN